MALAAAQLGVAEQITILNGSVSLLDTQEVTAQSEPLLAPVLATGRSPVCRHLPRALGVPVAARQVPAADVRLRLDLHRLGADVAGLLPALEQIIRQLNDGKVPTFFYAETTEAQPLIASRRFTLVPLVGM
jgi:hypothetical protein